MIKTSGKLAAGSILALCLAGAALHAQNAPAWVIGPFARPAGDPVIAPQPDSTFTDPITKAPVAWEALHTFNPAAIVREGKVYVLYRAEDNSGTNEIGGHTSRLGLAESKDGIHFTRMAAPVLYPADDGQKAREWPGGVEDPRIVESEDGTYVLTYTQWNRQTYSIGIATSRDLVHWAKQGPAFLTAAGGKYADLRYKSGAIVTRVVKDRLLAARINGLYWMYWGEGAVHLATSPDLVHWTPVEDPAGQPVALLTPRAGRFDSTFPEAGPPPVVTSAGIVVLYNGKNAASGGDPALGVGAYAAGEALFDAKNPTHLLTETAAPVLKPELPFEKTGQYAAGTTFAEGLVWFHKHWMLYYGCADSLVAVAEAPAAPLAETAVREDAPERPASPAAAAAPAVAPAEASGFYLHDRDTVVFYGDSITEQNYYNQFVEVYTATRFPGLRVRFYGAGVGGDRVTGGSGGPIDERLVRDVFAERPTVVTVMLGMNDGSYRATTPEIESAYVRGYEHLLGSLKENLPGVRLTLIGPSPFDDVTREPWFEGGYNGTMQRFAQLDEGLARKYGAAFVDFNPTVVAAVEKAQALDPRLAKLLLPDRVHPDAVTHWVMAMTLLKGWNAPALVSSVTLDAREGKLVEAQNAAVDHIERVGGALRWTEIENALPLPISRYNAAQATLFDITDIEKQLDEEPLRVTGLNAGSYTLTIDGSTIGTFGEAELAAGVNLANYGTPMFHQAERVGWLVRDQVEAHYIHLRMRVRKADTGNPDTMQAFEDGLQQSIWKEAAPQLHAFTLAPAVAAAK